MGAVLVLAAFVVPRIASEHWRSTLYAGAAPIFGNWLLHAGWGTVPAVVIAVLVVLHGPTVAAKLPWRRLLAVSWLTTVGWAFALAMVDGWHRGFAGRLTDSHEYLHEVPGVTDIPAMLRGFSDRILDFQADSWTTHVSGHPPGALLFFVLLDRIGLRGGGWAGFACMLIGCSAVVAVAVALRALGAEDRARMALPFLTIAPAALWIAVSADAMFTGVTAWAVALLALAVRQPRRWAVASGVLFGLGIYLSYGLVLMALPATAVLVAGRTIRPLLPALAGALAVAAAFTLTGFWWLDGYHLVVERYYQGIASERPYAYWVWANLAATVCAVGLATAAALPHALAGIGDPRQDIRDALAHRADALRPGRFRAFARPTDPRRTDLLHARDARPAGAVAVPTGPTDPRRTDLLHAGDADAWPAGVAAVPTDALRSVRFRAFARRADPRRMDLLHAGDVDVRPAGVAAVPAGPTDPRRTDLPHAAARLDDHGRAAYDRGISRVDPATMSRSSHVSPRAWLPDPTSLLVAAGLCAILVADISGLSKAETERIWLPFDVWLLAATAFLPRSHARAWLAVQALGTLLIAHTILTNW